MNQTVKIVSLLTLGVVLFLVYRYYTFGKGNKQLSYATTFGWPRYDKKQLEAAGLVQTGPTTLEAKAKVAAK